MDGDLQQISADISSIKSRLDVLETRTTVILEQMKTDLDNLGRMNRAINQVVREGNGKSLVSRVGYLEREEENRSKKEDNKQKIQLAHYFTIWSAVVGLAVREFWSYLSK